MRRESVYLLLAVVLAVPVLFVGCHGGGAGPAPAPVIPDAILQAAVDTQIAPLPEPSPIDSDCSIALWTLLNDPPATREQLGAALADFTARVNANPNQAACQLGLCLLMLARAADDVGTDVGTDIFEELANIELQSLVRLANAEGPGGLVAAYKNIFPNAAGEAGTAQVNSLAEINGRGDGQLQAALRAYMLPVLYNANGGIFQRMAKFADCGYRDALVTLGTVGGPVVTMYTADFNMFAADAEAFSAMLLEGMAYNWELDGWTPPDDPRDLDSNQDGFLTPNEYFPPAPFGTIKPNGAAELGIARERYLDAIRRAKHALETIPDDPTDLLNMLFADLDEQLGYIIVVQVGPPENSVEALLLILSHFEALLEGEQTLEVEYWQEGGRHAILPFRVNVSRMFTAPVLDFRTLAPKLTIVAFGVDVQNGDGTEYGVIFGFQDFPDPTFNGVFPDIPILLAALAQVQADWIQINHHGHVWGPIPVSDILEFLGADLGADPFWTDHGVLLWLEELLGQFGIVPPQE